MIIHSGCTIAHDCNIQQGNFISGHVGFAGASTLGKFCWVGVGAVIVDKLFIANYTTITCRSLVVRDIVDENTTYNKHKF